MKQITISAAVIMICIAGEANAFSVTTETSYYQNNKLVDLKDTNTVAGSYGHNTLQYGSNGDVISQVYWDPSVFRVFSEQDKTYQNIFTSNLANPVASITLGDSITLTSNTLSVGTKVNVDFTFGGDAVISGSSSNTYGYGDFFLEMKVGDVNPYQGSDMYLSGNSAITQTLSGQIGGTYNLFALVSAGIYAPYVGLLSQPVGSTAFGAVDGLHTAHLLASSTSDVTVVSSAGFIYPAVASVPLPGAIWLFSSALIGLIGFNRRKAPVALTFGSKR